MVRSMHSDGRGVPGSLVVLFYVAAVVAWGASLWFRAWGVLDLAFAAVAVAGGGAWRWRSRRK